MSTPPNTPAKQIKVPVVKTFKLVHQQRLVVFMGRPQFGLQDVAIAVPWAMVEALAAQIRGPAAMAELSQMGMQIQFDGPQKQ